MYMRHALAAAGAALFLAATASAAERSIAIEGAWARPTPPGAPTGAGYLTIRNHGPADRLVAVASPVASRVEVHEMTMEGTIMHMHPLPDGVAVPAGGTVTLAPRGAHLMMIGLKQPLKEGETVPVTLRFQRAGEVKAALKVRQPPPGR